EADKDVVYDINVLHGNDSTTEGAIRVQDKFVSFTLMKEVSNDNWETIIDSTSIEDFEKPFRIYVDKIDANTTSTVTHKYRLYVWLNRNMTIYGGDLTSESGDYSIAEYKKLYTSVKVQVTGDYKDKNVPIHTVTFDYNDGVTESTTKRVLYNEYYGALPTPTRDGYTFIGWSYLPNDYVQLDYIESYGYQYIDTLYKPSANTGIEAEYQFTSLNTQQRLFGIESDNNSFPLSYSFYINGSSKWAYAYKNGSGNWVSTNINADTNRHKLMFNVENKKIMIDNSQIYYNDISGLITNTTNYNLLIFASQRDSGIIEYGRLKLYKFKIYENGELVHNYIPCKNTLTSKIGLYDIITGDFYSGLGFLSLLGGDSIVVGNDTIVTEEQDHILYATWNKNPIVTFDANGGTIDTVSKQVTYHENYGELPIPTRGGYTFMGWNGKNLLNPKDIYYVTSGGGTQEDAIVYDKNTGIYTSNTNVNNKVFGYDILKYITYGKSYTFSAEIVSNDLEGNSIIGFDLIKSGTRFFSGKIYQVQVGKRVSYTYQFSNDVSSVAAGLTNSGYSTGLKYKNLQLEEGDTATEYEPYYITSGTKVVQDKDHTLKAIWKENE
ncbi:MAG: InlB B-repeat-containing protein, partial [Bacilli bacterium]|nr:InlB B-repeat-containing protein [Bacilli bacterium]